MEFIVALAKLACLLVGWALMAWSAWQKAVGRPSPDLTETLLLALIFLILAQP